jgi:NRAMP (natural resistance-associated macrophage protein)-like metal ion transporter
VSQSENTAETLKGRSLLRLLGPGIITGASDDDPSGIATYSQVGARFGYELGWTLVFSYPLMCVIQEISARIGRVTGRGIAGDIRRHHSRWLLYSIVLLLIVANTVNLGADIGAMAAALKLLIGGPQLLYVAGFAVGSLLLEIFVSYARYAAILKWLTLSLLAYVGTVFVADIPWAQVAQKIMLPTLGGDRDYLTAIVAVLGTTISPYLFFWQAESEVEDEEADPLAAPLREVPTKARREFRRIRWDTYVGMAVSNMIALFIVITTAATLNAQGITEIQTSAQAAEALRPIAGPFAFFLFAAGIIGTGLLAVPVLAGSAAYALGEAMNWPVGLDRQPSKAKGFYVAIALGTLLGGALNFTPIDPITALYWAAIINGVISVPVIAIMLLMCRNREVMGPLTLRGPLWLIGGLRWR